MRIQRSITTSLLFLLASSAQAGETAAVPTPTSRYTLKQIQVEDAPQRGSRYAIRARFSQAERAGGLHEGANFTLIGKFAKGGSSCSAFALFGDGFE